ncbi:uncharacterized protein LOC143645287 [Tamandua tetradactyla]|uniref:uncharacterized protein LOC143645287 n=1 Tax=Tamandua tetradactyla TaxID=48850 RepID=UPI004053ECF0
MAEQLREGSPALRPLRPAPGCARRWQAGHSRSAATWHLPQGAGPRSLPRLARPPPRPAAPRRHCGSDERSWGPVAARDSSPRLPPTRALFACSALLRNCNNLSYHNSHHLLSAYSVPGTVLSALQATASEQIRPRGRYPGCSGRSVLCPPQHRDAEFPPFAKVADLSTCPGAESKKQQRREHVSWNPHAPLLSVPTSQGVVPWPLESEILIVNPPRIFCWTPGQPLLSWLLLTNEGPWRPLPLPRHAEEVEGRMGPGRQLCPMGADCTVGALDPRRPCLGGQVILMSQGPLLGENIRRLEQTPTHPPRPTSRSPYL